MDTNPIAAGLFINTGLNVGGCLGVGTGANGVFSIVQYPQRNPNGIDKRSQCTFPVASTLFLFTVNFHHNIDADTLAVIVGFGFAGQCMSNEFPRSFGLDVLISKDFINHVGGDFFAGLIGVILDRTAELNLQTTGQDQAVFLLKQIRNTPLTRLAVDANYSIVITAYISWVNGQIRDFPHTIGIVLVKAFFDGILVRSGKCGKDQITHIRVAWVYGQLVAILDAAAYLVNIREVQPGINSLGI